MVEPSWQREEEDRDGSFVTQYSVFSWSNCNEIPPVLVARLKMIRL